MPTLTWVGKDKVVNHHHDVPFKVLQQQSRFDAPDGSPVNSTDNRIIHGDNLEALKSLLPEFEGKVNCIYIDPPYNTGNEGWLYNDAVNDPKIRKWLGQVVGKEGEDLSRHDKWLCMMYPRLKLLHRLLAKDGVIFISIDDNEQANLRLICDEIFGSGNFVTNIIWRSSDSSNNDSKQFSTDYNHTLLYSKKIGWESNRLERIEENNAHYKNPDSDPNGDWFSGNVSSPNPRINLTFDIISPNGNIIKPPKNGWRWRKERIDEMIERKEIIFSDDQTRIVKKTYLKDQSGIIPSNIWWDIDDTGHNRNAKYELIKIFDEFKTSDIFKTPKPTKFIEKVLKISCSKNAIILDSFAGSGTTAHATLKLNAQDGGNRRFILIEMEDYADTITAERVRRVMSGYGEGNKQVPGLGGSFAYYTVGEPIFNPDDTLNEAVGIDVIRNYVAYSEGIPGEDQTAQDNAYTPYLMGLNSDTAWIFYYEPKQVTCLDLDFLGLLKFGAAKPGTAIIYADKCLLTKEFMTQYGIIFKKIPRDITRF